MEATLNFRTGIAMFKKISNEHFLLKSTPNNHVLVPMTVFARRADVLSSIQVSQRDSAVESVAEAKVGNNLHVQTEDHKGDPGQASDKKPSESGPHHQGYNGRSRCSGDGKALIGELDQEPGMGFWCDCEEGPDLELSGVVKQQLEHDIESIREWGQRRLLETISGSCLDMLAVCAPWDSPLVKAAREAGGKALAIGVHNGYDLSTTKGLRKAFALVRRTKPKYIHVSPPFGPWSSVQNAKQRTPRQVQRLAEERVLSRRLLKNCCKIVAVQRYEQGQNAGCSHEPFEERHAGGKHPLRARSWQLPEFREIVRLCGGHRFTVHNKL